MNRNNYGRSSIRFLHILIVIILLSVLVAGFFLFDSLVNRNVERNEPYKKRIEYNGETYVEKRNLETVLLIGTDQWKSQTQDDFYINDQRSDFLMLFILDRDEQTCHAIHINRDTVTDVRVLGIGGKVIKTVPMQIALSHSYGSGGNDSCINTVRAVSGLLNGISIDHYVAMTMDVVPLANDMVGGVDVVVMDDFSDVDPLMHKDETVTLQGDQALLYIRERGGIDNKTNVRRMERQRQYIEAFWEKMCLHTSDEDFYSEMFRQISEYIITDYTSSQIQKIVSSFEKFTENTIHTIPGKLIEGEQYMEFYADEKGLQELILSLFYEKENK